MSRPLLGSAYTGLALPAFRSGRDGRDDGVNAVLRTTFPTAEGLPSVDGSVDGLPLVVGSADAAHELGLDPGEF